MKFTLPLLTDFGNALAMAFPEFDDFDAFAIGTGCSLGLEADFGAGHSHRKYAYAFLREVLAAHGDERLEQVLDLALEHRPGNDDLRKFAKALGLGRLSAPKEMLKTINFDLQPLEQVWRPVLAHPDRQLRIFLLCASDRRIVESVIERLRTYIGKGVSPRKLLFTLDAMLKSAGQTFDLIEKLRPALATQSVVCHLHANEAGADAIDRFLADLHARFPKPLDHHFIFVVSTHVKDALRVPCVRLPEPVFDASHLDQWVEEVTADKEWPTPLKVLLKRWLRANAPGDQGLPPDAVYFALEAAIEKLSLNPKVAELEAHFTLT